MQNAADCIIRQMLVWLATDDEHVVSFPRYLYQLPRSKTSSCITYQRSFRLF